MLADLRSLWVCSERDEVLTLGEHQSGNAAGPVGNGTTPGTRRTRSGRSHARYRQCWPGRRTRRRASFIREAGPGIRETITLESGSGLQRLLPGQISGRLNTSWLGPVLAWWLD